jgi:hypothetical protein
VILVEVRKHEPPQVGGAVARALMTSASSGPAPATPESMRVSSSPSRQRYAFPTGKRKRCRFGSSSTADSRVPGSQRVGGWPPELGPIRACATPQVVTIRVRAVIPRGRVPVAFRLL